jgi:hypothetical protein
VCTHVAKRVQTGEYARSLLTLWGKAQITHPPQHPSHGPPREATSHAGAPPSVYFPLATSALCQDQVLEQKSGA